MLYTQKYIMWVFFQVADVEKILGVVYTENIQVTAEAYDVDLEISPGTNEIAFRLNVKVNVGLLLI